MLNVLCFSYYLQILNIEQQLLSLQILAVDSVPPKDVIKKKINLFILYWHLKMIY